MRKVLSALTLAALLLGLAACAATPPTPSPAAPTETSLTSPESPGASQPAEDTTDDAIRVLVAYFSATGNTRPLAQAISDSLGADIYEIIPETPYTQDDLNYHNDDCRANREQNDDAARPAISGSVENMEDYDVIFLGYPIWWGKRPRSSTPFWKAMTLTARPSFRSAPRAAADITTAPSLLWLPMPFGRLGAGSAAVLPAPRWRAG